jgi:hypothetical protein
MLFSKFRELQRSKSHTLLGTDLRFANSFHILTTKAKEMYYFTTYFGKELYMFRTDLLSIIRSLDTVFTASGICHTSYVDCLLASSGWNVRPDLARSQHN